MYQFALSKRKDSVEALIEPSENAGNMLDGSFTQDNLTAEVQTV